MRAPVHLSMVPDLLPTPPILDHWELFSAAYVGCAFKLCIVAHGAWVLFTSTLGKRDRRVSYT